MSKNRVNSPRPILVPRLGIDLRVPVTDMPSDYSPFMINFHCETGRLIRRRPHSVNAASVAPVTGSVGDIPKIIALKSSSKVIAISGSYIWDNEGTTPVLKSTYSLGMNQHYVDYWDDGNALYFTDTTGVLSLNLSTLVPTLAFTNAAVDDRRPITKYRERFYWTDGTDLNYSNAGATSGTVNTFPAPVNGLIEALATFNYGTNNRSEQMLVMVSRNGELLIYAGTYPAGTDWYLVNKFQLGEGDSNGEYSWDIHEIEGDVLINHKHTHKVYSLTGLLSNKVGESEWKPSDKIEALWTNTQRDLTIDFTSVKNMTYWPERSAIVMFVRFFANGESPWLDAWKDVALPGFKDDAGDEHYSFIFYFDLNTGSVTPHTYPTVARAFNTFTLSCASAGKDGIFIGDFATASGTGRGVIIKLFDNQRDLAITDWDGTTTTGLIAYSAYATFAPQQRTFDVEKANFVLMFSNLHDDHNFAFGFNDNFNHSAITTFKTFDNGATPNIARGDLLEASSIGNGLVFQIRENGEGDESAGGLRMFEFFGATILEEIGGLY